LLLAVDVGKGASEEVMRTCDTIPSPIYVGNWISNGLNVLHINEGRSPFGCLSVVDSAKVSPDLAGTFVLMPLKKADSLDHGRVLFQSLRITRPKGRWRPFVTVTTLGRLITV